LVRVEQAVLLAQIMELMGVIQLSQTELLLLLEPGVMLVLELLGRQELPLEGAVRVGYLLGVT
jgi:hypothetical protein